MWRILLELEKYIGPEVIEILADNNDFNKPLYNSIVVFYCYLANLTILQEAFEWFNLSWDLYGDIDV